MSWSERPTGEAGSAAPVAERRAATYGSRVEVTDPLATAEPTRKERAGFARRGVLLSRATD